MSLTFKGRTNLRGATLVVVFNWMWRDWSYNNGHASTSIKREQRLYPGITAWTMKKIIKSQKPNVKTTTRFGWFPVGSRVWGCWPDLARICESLLHVLMCHLPLAGEGFQVVNEIFPRNEGVPHGF